MASFPYIVIQFTGSTGPSNDISFNVNGNTETFVVTVNEPITPFRMPGRHNATLAAEVFKDTALQSLDPSNYSVQLSVDRVIITSKVDNASYNFGTVTINGPNIVLVEQKNANGSTTTGTSTPSGIDVTLISHRCVDLYAAQSKSFIYGNVGDLIETTIEFTLIAPTAFIDFKYGLIDKEEDLYNSDDNFQMPDDFFISPTTGDIQAYRGSTSGTLNPSLPKSFDTGSVVVSNIGGNDYRLIHTHILGPLVRTEDVSIDALITPEEYDGSNCLKYVFQIDVRDDEIDPDYDQSTRESDLSQLIISGNTGYQNEFLNGSPAKYTLTSFQFNTLEGELNPAVDSEAEAVIESNSGNFSATTDIILFIQLIKDNFEGGQTLDENLLIERVQIQADGTPVSGTNLLDVTATFVTTTIDLSFTVAKGSYTGQYAIWAAVSNDPANINHNNILLKVGESGTAADLTTINFGTFLNAPRADFNFNYHYNNDVSASFNHVRSFIEDRLVCRWRIENYFAGNDIKSFTIRIRSRTTGQVLESLEVLAQDIPFDSDRDFKLEDTDPKIFRKITETTTDVWDFEYGFQIWDTFVNSDAVVFECAVNVDQTVATGEIVNDTKIFQSPDFELGNYDTTKNTALEPNVLRGPTSIELYDEVTSVQVKGIIKNRTTLVRAIFQDDNLNDLQATQAQLTGYNGINQLGDVQNTYEMFHSTVSNGVLRPWLQPSGYVPFNTRITKVDVKTAWVESTVDWDKLDPLFPNIEKFDVSSRLDKLEPFIACLLFKTERNGNITVSNATTGSSIGLWNTPAGTFNLNDVGGQNGGYNGTLQDLEYCNETPDDVEELNVSSMDIQDPLPSFSQFTFLTSLKLSSGYFTSADFTPLINLELLWFGSDGSFGGNFAPIPVIDVSLNVLLRELRVNHSEVETLTFSKTVIEQIYSYNNKHNGTFDASDCPELDDLRIGNNATAPLSPFGIDQVDVSNSPKLRLLFCERNRVANIDLTDNVILEQIRIADGSAGGNLVPYPTLTLTNNPLIKVIYINNSSCQNIVMPIPANSFEEVRAAGNIDFGNLGLIDFTYLSDSNELRRIDYRSCKLSTAQLDSIVDSIYANRMGHTQPSKTLLIGDLTNPATDNASVSAGALIKINDLMTTYSWSITYNP